MAISSYRPEIDGLRAISVIGVVLFHAGLGFSGGYVGVDVFFVISGFLITGIIVRDLQEHRFSMAEFWARRIRRILPAVTTMVLCVLLCGLILLDPHALTKLARATIAQAIMLANWNLYQESGYFAESSDFKPLLHTWTLALEEQFYVFLPLGLTFLFRFLRNYTFAVIAVIALCSLGLSAWMTPLHPSPSFLLLPTRAWELLAGSLLALGKDRISPSRPLAEFLGMAGLLMILSAMLHFDSKTIFPGLAALLPVGGAVLFIASSGQNRTLARRILSARPFVFCGLISYSLYLWHWPLFAFSKHVLIAPTLGVNLALVLLSCILGYASWRYVEKPMRHGSLLKSRRNCFAFGAGTILLISLGAGYFIQSKGFPMRFETEIQTVYKDVQWRGLEYQSTDGSPVPIGHNRQGTREHAPQFILWGDSHAMVVAELLDKLAAQHLVEGEAYVINGQIPVPGLYRPAMSKRHNEEALLRKENIIQSVIQRQIPNVILVNRWSVNIDGISPQERERYGGKNSPLVVDKEACDSESLTPRIASASVNRGLRDMAERLSKAGTTLWLLKQVPETTDLEGAQHFLTLRRFPEWNELPSQSISLEQHLERQEYTNLAFEGLASPMLQIIDTTENFFNAKNGLLTVYSSRAHYWDDDHLTRYGTEIYLRPALERVIQSIAKE